MKGGGCHSQRPLCLVGEAGPSLVMTFPGCGGPEADQERVGGGRWAFQVGGWQVWEVSVGWRVAGWGPRGHWGGPVGRGPGHRVLWEGEL